MFTIHPDGLTVEQQRVVADRIDSRRLIALRPIRIIGPFAFYWSFGEKVRVFCGRMIVIPRVRWIGRAPITHHHQGDEPR